MKYKLITFCTLLSVFLNPFTASAQLQRPFTPRFKTTAQGAMTFVSNSIMTSTRIVPAGCGYANLPAAAPNHNEAPPGTTTGVTTKNDAYVGAYIDIDGNSTTFNSSSATLSLPACRTIAFAGLYWGAGIARNQGSGCAASGAAPMSAVNDWHKVKLKVPGAADYVSLTATVMDTVASTFHGYQGFADITSLVQSAGPGAYTVANVACPTDKVNTYGGWTIVVVYEDETKPLRNFIVFDGIASVYGATTKEVDFSLKGFSTPAIGPVGARMGMVTYDGDRDAIDGFFVKNKNSAWVDQSLPGESAAATSKPGDIWNSSITLDGVPVTNRTPAYGNTMGYDAHIFSLNNQTKKYLNNNDSLLYVRINTNSEGYVLGVFAVEIDNYIPKMLAEDKFEDLNGGVLEMGDTVRITTRVRNLGNDKALNTVFMDTLPEVLQYVPGSMVVNGQPVTDATGDDVASYEPAQRMIRVNIGTGANATQGGAMNKAGVNPQEIIYLTVISSKCEVTGATTDVHYHSSRVAFNAESSNIKDTAFSRQQALPQDCLYPEAPRAFSVVTSCDPLPLRLISFRAAARPDASVLLQWQAAEDADGSHYKLMTSPNGRDFSLLYVQDIQEAKSLASYRYTDARMHEGQEVFYQLVLVNKDGSISKSQVARVRLKHAGKEPELYPNPATNSILLRHSAPTDDSPARVVIYDAMGKAVLQVPAVKASQEISLQRLTPGIYFLHYQTGEESYRLRFVKQ